MDRVKCLYCGGSLEDTLERCPHCGAPSHFVRLAAQRRQRRFVLAFIAVALFCLLMILVLPR